MTLFGKSVVVTRATQAVVSLLAPLAVAMILKQVFKAALSGGSARCLLAVAPAWFLHSRTGFETVMMVVVLRVLPVVLSALSHALAAVSLCGDHVRSADLLHLLQRPDDHGFGRRWCWRVSDIRYHLKHWRTTVPGLGLIALLALPVLRFRATNPQFMTVTLRTMDSYWFHDLTLAQKIEQFMRTWAQGLSPAYWFIPSQTLLVRHRMAGYGNLSVWLLPFFLIGVGWCLWRIKSPAHRARFF